MSFFTLRRQMDDLMNQMLSPVLYDPFFDVTMGDLPLLGPGDIQGQGQQQQQGQLTGESGSSSSTSTSLAPSIQGQAQLSVLSPQLIRTDVHEDEKSYQITAEIPGVPKENVKVNIDNGYLVISGDKKEDKKEEKEERGRRIRRSERRYGSFQRSFRLPTNCDQTQVQAKFQNGVLNLQIPKTEEKNPRQQQIQIQ
jgi:HSP20 family protein